MMSNTSKANVGVYSFKKLEPVAPAELFKSISTAQLYLSFKSSEDMTIERHQSARSQNLDSCIKSYSTTIAKPSGRKHTSGTTNKNQHAVQDLHHGHLTTRPWNWNY